MKSIEPPRWVLSYEDARGGFENQLFNASKELSLLEEDIQIAFEKANITSLRWLVSKATDDGVQALVELERDIGKFQKWLAQRYRKAFEDRLKGTDHIE